MKVIGLAVVDLKVDLQHPLINYKDPHKNSGKCC